MGNLLIVLSKITERVYTNTNISKSAIFLEFKITRKFVDKVLKMYICTFYIRNKKKLMKPNFKNARNFLSLRVISEPFVNL